MRSLISFFIISHLFTSPAISQEKATLNGAWELSGNDTKGLWIFTNGHFAITYYTDDPAEFGSTSGGKWSLGANGQMELKWEFHTMNNEKVGETELLEFALNEERMEIDDKVWQRVDDGTPGALAGAWLITGRMRGDEMSAMTPDARKTMKIMSGTKFQWIAYNSDTGEFFGTGGGSYVTEGGKYIEMIEFFSRDNSRVGASLDFNFELKDGAWHHSGKSSKGDPIYEIWSRRSVVGI